MPRLKVSFGVGQGRHEEAGTHTADAVRAGTDPVGTGLVGVDPVGTDPAGTGLVGVDPVARTASAGARDLVGTEPADPACFPGEWGYSRIQGPVGQGHFPEGAARRRAAPGDEDRCS